MSNGDPALTSLSPDEGEHDVMVPAPDLLGDSPAIRLVREAIRRAALERLPVVVVAEAGLRPEIVAREIHARRGGPLVAVECATTEPARPETELFGPAGRGGGEPHDVEVVAPGSALARGIGGVLFLGTVTELPVTAQRRLARVLRDREVQIGAAGAAPLDLQVVASVPPQVEDEIGEGRFRADLFRRLCGLRIELAPLRERQDDVRTMASWLARHVCTAAGIVPKSFTQAALTLLAALPWRGNTRELMALLERVVPAAPGSVVRLEDVLGHLRLEGAPDAMPVNGGLRSARRQFERAYIAAVLRHHRWQMSAAAKALGIQRANLYRKARQLGIRAGERRRRS